MDFVFNGNDILSFIFPLKPLLPLDWDQYLKKSYFLQVETILIFQTLIQMEAVFWST